MIITRLFCGLGNQMFQYAAGLALAQRRRTVLKLDVSWFNEKNVAAAHEQYSLGCFNITEQFANEVELDRCRGHQLNRSEMWAERLARKLELGRYAQLLSVGGNWHVPPTFAFFPEFFEQPDGTLLDGSFQSERFFEPVAGILRAHFSFRYPPTPAVAAMAARIGSGPSIAVHFRRGDYAQKEFYRESIGVVALDYYERALQLIRAQQPEATFYLFSDDIESIEREFRPPGPHVFVKATQPWNAYDELRLMSLCDHFVIANSTFSWWAAWLGAFPGKMVICPEPWFANSQRDARDVLPLRWIRLPKDGEADPLLQVASAP